MKLHKPQLPGSGKKNEKKLFNDIKKRDKDAFIEAYDLYSDQIFRFIYFKVSNNEDAKDLTSSVFLKTWNYIKEKNISDYNTLRALLYKVARTTVIDHYRKNKNIERIAIDNEELNIDLPDTSQSNEKRMEIKSDFKLIEARMQELKDEYREIIVLKYIDELSISEIAKVINKSKGNTRVLAHRSIKALKELIDKSESK